MNFYMDILYFRKELYFNRETCQIDIRSGLYYLIIDKKNRLGKGLYKFSDLETFPLSRNQLAISA